MLRKVFQKKTTVKRTRNSYPNKFFNQSVSCASYYTKDQSHVDNNQETTTNDIPPSPSHSFAPYVSNLLKLDDELPKKAKVIICGGGIFGTSMAYHLAKLGWGPDTLLIDQGRLGGPLSWRGSGFLGGVKFSKAEVTVLKSSLDVVKSLYAEGHDVGWKKCGSLHLARNKPRMTHFRKMMAISKARGTDCSILRPQEIKELCEPLNVDDLVGGFWVPDDGVCDLYKLCFNLIKLARQDGTRMVEDCEIKQIHIKNNKVAAVSTDKGTIECDIFVNAGGTWARKIGLMSDPMVKIPIHAVQHHYLYTQPVELRNLKMPAIRDPDGNIYMREYNGGVLAGAFNNKTELAYERGKFPKAWHNRELPVDWDNFSEALDEIINRFPLLHSTILNQMHNMADTFSSDCKWIFGQSPEFRNYFLAAGMKSSGSNAATGMGKILSDWIVTGQASMDAYDLDTLRFLPVHNNRNFLRERITEVPGIHYGIEFPFLEFKTGRCLRVSPIFPKLKAAGAHFGQVMGYERPSYFVPETVVEHGSTNKDIEMHSASTTTWSKPHWFQHTAREYQALRETCGILDYSSFAKFDIWSSGDEAFNALQYLCSNDVNIPIGGIIHTGMQNQNGGYENDCSLARIADNHFMMIAPTIQQTRCLNWLRRNLPSDGSIRVTDVTSMYTAICLMGPRSRVILSELTDVDLSPKAFPFFSFKQIDVGLANGVRAMNLTHTGELGWVLYIPNEFALNVYDSLVQVGREYGLIHAGYYAMRSLRVEKFYAFWGQDLDSSTTPMECGRAFRTKLNKDIDFLGRAALEKQRQEGVKRLYVHLTLEDHDSEVDPWPWGGEPIYRNGKFAGVTTTTGYGFTLQKIVCLGFIRNVNQNDVHELVTPEYVMNAEYEIDIAGVKYSAKVSLRSPTLLSKFQVTDKDRYLATQTVLKS